MNDLRQNGATPSGTSGERAVLSKLERIDARLARIEATAERLESFERMLVPAVGAATDTFDDIVERLRQRGVDVDQRLHVLVDVVERLTSPEALAALRTLLDKLPLLQHLLDSGILAESSVDVVGRAGAALTTARRETTKEVGLWGAARALSDEDIKRAMGFLLRVAQLFGRSLDEEARANLLPTRGQEEEAA